jgi:hypothetical protein
MKSARSLHSRHTLGMTASVLLFGSAVHANEPNADPEAPRPATTDG